MVTLVGAGAGDVALLTVGGKKALEQAEVILYDRLISPSILRLMPTSAVKINVGKTAGRHPLPQEEINALLLRYGQQGKEVVRLKGGDCFLFGRGGEEVALLEENAVAYRVFAGVSSILAATSCAGIPVTHRGISSSLHVFTGHKKGDEALGFDYSHLVKLEGTLLFLMSVSSATEILQGLLSAGLPCDYPTAIIEEGARVGQRVFRGTVETMPEIMEMEGIQSPSILMVGAVCQLDFSWFQAENQKKQLLGRKILLTAPEGDSALADLLEAEGAEVTVACRLRSRSVEGEKLCLSGYSAVIFTSKRGVTHFFQQLRSEGQDARALAGLSIAVVGGSTAKELKKYGLQADFRPSVPSGSILAQELAEKLEGKFLVVTGKPNSQQVQEALRERKREYEEYFCYEIQPVKEEIPLEKAYELILFTSGETVKAMSGFYPEFTKIPVICLGKTAEKEAKIRGYSCVTAENPDLASLCLAVKEYFYDRTS